MKMRVAFFILLIVGVIVLSGCGGAERETQAKVNDQQNVYNNNQPIHAYNWSLERQVVQQIYDYRTMKAIDTWSVWVSEQSGEPIDMCASKGFPIPYNTSLTNPLQKLYNYDSVVAQAEPNGLFPGGSTSSTWVLCVQSDGSTYPVYVEPNVITYPWAVKIVVGTDGRRRIERSGDPDLSTKIDLEKPTSIK